MEVLSYYFFFRNEGGIHVLMNWKAEDKRWIIGLIQQYFLKERDEEIGELAAENILEFFSETLGPHFYNAGVKDASKQAEAYAARLDEDLYALMRPIKK
jgi:uncharacterized protein (DUF2164 family)